MLEELLFCGYQTRFLESRIRELAPEEELSPEARQLNADPRTVAISFAMERRSDRSGDVCSPGPAAPGPALAFGGTPLEFLRHVTGRGTGQSGGRGAGLCWTDIRHGLFGGTGPPGTMTQVMAGAALAFKQRNEARVALAFESAQASESGAWHEGLNFAAAARLPLIVVMTDDARRRPVEGTLHKGDVGPAYGVELLTFSVEPLSQLLGIVGEARGRVLGGKGPAVIRLLATDDWSARWQGLDDLAQECRSRALVRESALDRVVDRAANDVEHAMKRLSNEPVPEGTEALGPILGDELRTPPWTRQDPPEPANQTPLEPKGAFFVV